MICPNCNYQEEEGRSFCSNCGTKFDMKSSDSSSPRPKKPASNPVSAKGEGGNKWLVWAGVGCGCLIILLILASLGIGGYMYLKEKEKEKQTGRHTPTPTISMPRTIAPTTRETTPPSTPTEPTPTETTPRSTETTPPPTSPPTETPTQPPTGDRFSQETQGIRNTMQAVMCQDVTEDFRPVGITNNFPAGTKTVYCYGAFEAEGSNWLRAFWYRGGDFLTTSDIKLDTTHRRVKLYIFSRGDSGLRSGNYKVELRYCRTNEKDDKGELIKELYFEIK